MNSQYALPTNGAGPAATADQTRTRWQRITRRFQALLRLLSRRRRARRRVLDLSHLDDRTLRDLGLTRSEIGSVASELGGRAAASRRRTDAEVWRSASAHFRTRGVDSSL